MNINIKKAISFVKAIKHADFPNFMIPSTIANIIEKTAIATARISVI